MEKGTWKYTTYTDPPSFAYMRIGADGETEEPTPFTSIPAAFWWFIVTATTGEMWLIHMFFYELDVVIYSFMQRFALDLIHNLSSLLLCTAQLATVILIQPHLEENALLPWP